jgi:hypothetical protein
MKVGDGPKPFSLPAGTATKAANAAAHGGGSLAGGNLLRTDTSEHVDRFEKAAMPAFDALLGAGKQSASKPATAPAGGGVAAKGAALLGALGTRLGLAEGDTRALMQRIDGLRIGRGESVAAAKGTGNVETALLDGLAAAADALARAQDTTSAESSLEWMIGQAGRLLKGDIASDIEAMSQQLESLRSASDRGKAALESGVSAAQRTGQKDVAAASDTLEELEPAMYRLENQLELFLRQIEELRSREAREEAPEPAQPGPRDPLAVVEQSVSEAHAVIRRLFDP